MSLGKIILETLKHYKDANLASEAAREKIKSDIIKKYLEFIDKYLVEKEIKLRKNATEIFFNKSQKVN